MKSNFIKSLVISTVGTVLVGCASKGTYEPPSYDDNYSKAYNIAKAGGINDGIKDMKLPESYTKGSIGGTMYDSADLYTTYFMNPSLGLTNWGSLGIGLLSKLLEDPSGHNNNIFGWMPNESGMTPEEARNKFEVAMQNAVVSAFKEMELDYKYHGSNWTYGQHLYTFSSEKYQCGNRCNVEFLIYKADTSGKSPDFISHPAKNTVAFLTGPNGFMDAYNNYTPKDEYNWLQIFSDKVPEFPQQELYAAISKHMPEWAYMYLAPNVVKTGAEKAIPFPVLLNEGKVDMFIRPE